MTEPLQVGQFAIVDHEPVDRGPNAGVFLGKGPADDRAELYIVAEGTTPAGEAFAGHVVSGAGNAWNTLDMSLTGALRRVFTDADRSLRDWNRKSIAQHRVSIGMSCFGRRGAQAVVAQVGPSVVYHRSGDEVAVYLPDEAHGRPLGLGGEPEAQLRRIEFAAGDRLLMLSTPAIRELDDELIGGILGLEEDKILAELYHRIQHLKNVTVVLVTRRGASTARREPQLPADEPAEEEYVIGEAAPEPPAFVSPRAEQVIDNTPRNSYQPSLFIEAHEEDGVSAARRRLVDVTQRARAAVAPAVAGEELDAIPAPLQRASGDNTLAALAAERRARAALAVAAAAAGHRRHNGGSVTTFDEPASADARRRHQRRDSFTRGLVREELPAAPDPHVLDVPLASEIADDLRARSSVAAPVAETIAGENAAAINTGGSLVKVRGQMTGRWKGDGSLSRRRPTAHGHSAPTWLIIVVGLGILLALVGAITVPGLLSGDDANAYAELIDDARYKIVTAEANPDPAIRRAELTDAQAMLLEAKEAPNAGPEADQLIAEVAAALAGMDAVRTPTAVEVVASLEQFGEKPVTAARLAVGGESAYILDSSSNQVITVAIATGERKAVYGEDKEAKRARPVAIAYLDTQDLGQPLLLVADSGRALWGIQPDGQVRSIEFAAPSNLTVTDIAVSGRDLYVLDAAASTVYRFAPGDSGFNAAPQKVLDTPDLAAARRLNVEQEILTADADGTIRRFAGQVVLALSEAGINKRLVAAQLPQPVGKGGDIAVLDPANDRIVVFRSDGAFSHQFKHKDFTATTALRMMPDGTAFTFSGGKLLRVIF
ncbi:MAG: hypothetical protein IT303_20070 [Dehalococcoidia bacterium]|nr:hypothetical protein [Dehalococcoidia bacterium]